MKSPRTLLFVLLAACTAGGVALAQAQPVSSSGVGPAGSGRVLAYQLVPGKTLRYKLTARIKGTIPLLGTPTPIDNGVISLVYAATPKTVLADGLSDVELKVESVDVELEGLPVPIGLEDAEKVLNQTVTFSKTGEVKKITGGGPLPFGVSIPGVDPKRLYSLLFPVVFPTAPVKPGDTWPYKSELLGGQRNKPAFTATLLPEDQSGADPSLARIKTDFSLNVDQNFDGDHKPVADASLAHRTMKGKISGGGILTFDANAGRFTKGQLNIKADISDDLTGKPQTPDEPKQIPSKVDAVVTLELQPDAPANTASGSP
ncbi:MAG: hypothetical protein ACP5VE_03230 [Chthonomonadales bacterium]